MRVKVLSVILAIVFAMCYSATLNAQGVAINADGTAADGSAMLDVKSTDAGILIPRMTLAQRNGIASPANGLMIYQVDGAEGFYYYNGTDWVRLTINEDERPPKWSGDANTTGTIGRTGNVGIGTTSPNGKLHISMNNNVNNPVIIDKADGSGTGPLMEWYGFSTTHRLQLTYNDGDYEFNTDNSLRDIRFAPNNNQTLIISTNERVGIGTTAPSQTLHVQGNMRLQGAFMPNNQAGSNGQILMSGGAGNSPQWGPEFGNVDAIDGIGKYYTGLFNINNNSYLQLTIDDPDMREESTVFASVVGERGTPYAGYLANLMITVESRDGAVRFHIRNITSYHLYNVELSYVAFY